MVRTWSDDAIAIEACPVCGSLQVRTVEPDWFALDLDRRGELRGVDVAFEIEFSCRDCGSHWH